MAAGDNRTLLSCLQQARLRLSVAATLVLCVTSAVVGLSLYSKGTIGSMAPSQPSDRGLTGSTFSSRAIEGTNSDSIGLHNAS